MDVLNDHKPVGQCSTGKCWGAEAIELLIVDEAYKAYKQGYIDGGIDTLTKKGQA